MTGRAVWILFGALYALWMICFFCHLAPPEVTLALLVLDIAIGGYNLIAGVARRPQ